jgi:quinol monooxygenase YgiN
MIYKIAQFKVKVEKLEECKEAINEFIREVRRNEADTLRYESFQKEDSLSFIHFMCFRNATAEEVHRSTPHVKRFVEVLYPNCEVEPHFTTMTLLSSM